MPSPPTLTMDQREEVLRRVDAVVRQHYFDPAYNGRDWPALVEAHRERILQAADPPAFELAVHGLLRELGTSHTGFFHQTLRRVPGRLALGAALRVDRTQSERRWVFQAVHEGGPAAGAGLRAGDLLLAVNGKPVVPPEQPMVPMGAEARLSLQRADGREEELRLAVPKPRWRHQPFAEPEPVTARVLDGDVGYLRAVLFPGLVGVDVARQIDLCIEQVSGCDRLVVDLRGHMGGGIGGLRLMSHLTPDRLPVGYSVTRRRAEQGYRKEDLPRFDRIPRSKWELPLLALRFLRRDQSVAVWTEGLGQKRFHGRIAVLIDETTVSAGEMVAAFAQENRLATLVGQPTPGRLVGGRSFKVGHGYLVAIPVGAYYTWGGRSFEGQGLEPEIAAACSGLARQGSDDPQLAKALEVVS